MSTKKEMPVDKRKKKKTTVTSKDPPEPNPERSKSPPISTPSPAPVAASSQNQDEHPFAIGAHLVVEWGSTENISHRLAEIIVSGQYDTSTTFSS